MSAMRPGVGMDMIDEIVSVWAMGLTTFLFGLLSWALYKMIRMGSE
jgi:hypothetical protein